MPGYYGVIVEGGVDNNPSSVSILFTIWLRFRFRFLEPLYISGDFCSTSSFC